MDLQPCDRFTWEQIIRRCMSLDATEKHVALTIATYSDPDGTHIFVGTELLCTVIGRSKPTVIRARSGLRDKGLLERVYERQKNGRKGVNDEYRLTFPADILSRFEMLDPD